MSYSCLEELQIDLDLHMLNKTNVLSKVGYKYDDGWFIITDNGICYLFDKNGNLDDIKKIKQLKEKHIRKDITKIIIPDSVMNIEEYAFFGCNSLTSVTIPDSVTSIGNCAFRGCSSLTSVTIPESVTSIGYEAFSGCSGLTSVTIGNCITNIGFYAFEYCRNLTSVTIGRGVKSIGDYAFYDCRKLTNLTFKGKTLKQVRKINYYPWGIEDKSIIHVE